MHRHKDEIPKILYSGVEDNIPKTGVWNLLTLAYCSFFEFPVDASWWLDPTAKYPETHMHIHTYYTAEQKRKNSIFFSIPKTLQRKNTRGTQVLVTLTKTSPIPTCSHMDRQPSKPQDNRHKDKGAISARTEQCWENWGHDLVFYP